MAMMKKAQLCATDMNIESIGVLGAGQMGNGITQVAACAGLIVGKGILFPGTFSRMASFINGVKVGLKVVLSTVPFFVIAGFLESFVTRHTEMPDWLAILIISLSLALILFYYVYYPIHLNKLQSKDAEIHSV
jgi:hypothetical protein